MFKVCKGRGVKGFSFFFFLVTYYNVYAFNKTELLKCGPEPTDLPLPPPPLHPNSHMLMWKSF